MCKHSILFLLILMHTHCTHMYNILSYEILSQYHFFFVTSSSFQWLDGCWFAHPHETFHQASRKFYKREIFKTDVIMSVRLVHTLGKCCVLMIKDFIKYQPEEFSEEDVYVCESRYLHKYKSIKKIKVSCSCVANILMTPPPTSHGVYLLASSLYCYQDPPPSHSLGCHQYLLAISLYHNRLKWILSHQQNRNQSLNTLRMRLPLVLVLIVTRVIIAHWICPSLMKQRYIFTCSVLYNNVVVRLHN